MKKKHFSLGYTIILSTLLNFTALYAQNNPLPEIELPPSFDERYIPGTFTFQTDQDFFFVSPSSKNEDRNYTQGTTFGYSHPSLVSSWAYWPLRIIGDSLKNSSFYSSSLAIGGTAFTPRKIDSINPIVGDRPFAFLFYLSTDATWLKTKTVTTRHESTKHFTISHTFRINYGMLGTKLGYEFQSFAHKHIVQGRPKDPKGWNTQISLGGKPTILFEYNRFRPLIREELANTRRFLDAGWNFGGSIGYYDRIYTNIFGRLGYLKSGNLIKWNNGGWASINGASYQMLFPDESGALEKVKSGFRNTINYLAQNSEAFFYGKITTTAMLRNSLLVGQRFSNSDEYTLNPEWVHTGLLELEWGAVIAFEHKRAMEVTPRNWGIKFRQVYRSPEFNSKIFPERWHYYGSLGLFVSVR